MKYFENTAPLRYAAYGRMKATLNLWKLHSTPLQTFTVRNLQKHCSTDKHVTRGHSGTAVAYECTQLGWYHPACGMPHPAGLVQGSAGQTPDLVSAVRQELRSVTSPPPGGCQPAQASLGKRDHAV